LTSMDADGVQNGFDQSLTKAVRNAVNIPVIASGGAGKVEHFAEILQNADAALAASVFHFGTLKISEVKKCLERAKFVVRR